MLRHSPNVHSIIDHGRLFTGQPPGPAHTTDLVTPNLMRGAAEQHGTDTDRERLYNSMSGTAEQHAEAYRRSLTSITHWLDSLQSIDKSTVLRFIKERSEKNWMSDRLGII